MSDRAHSQLLGQLFESLGVDSPEVQDALAAALRGGDGERDRAGPSRRERALSGALRRSEKINAALVAKIEMLACALGACPSCWGNDAECPDCGGIGRPGRMAPDPQCFDRFVAPVIQRLNAVPGPYTVPDADFTDIPVDKETRP